MDCTWLNASHQNPVIKLWEQTLNEADVLSNRAELKALQLLCYNSDHKEQAKASEFL